MKKRIVLFLIRIICVLFIVSGTAGFITVCSGQSVTVPSSPHDHTYRETGNVDGAEGALYSLGIICIGGIGLLCTRKNNEN